MTDYREIEAIKKNPGRARSLAEILSGMKDIGWTDWETDFLESMSRCTDELSTRQGEKLVELREASIWYDKIDGFSLKLLINNCYLNRDLLSDSDQTFIESLHERGDTRLHRRQAAWVMRCARAVGAVEPYQGGGLNAPQLDDDA